MAKPSIQSWDEFWPFYLGEHALATTRRWHFIGTNLGLLALIGAAVTGLWPFLVLAPLFGYGCAWYSHFFIEKNRPASFKYPAWSFKADLKLCALTWTGRIDAEVSRHVTART